MVKSDHSIIDGRPPSPQIPYLKNHLAPRRQKAWHACPGFACYEVASGFSGRLRI